MKRTLVTVQNLDDVICRECGAFYQTSSMILTPGARDELHRRGIRIQYGEAPAGSCCSGAAPLACDGVDAASLAGASSVEELLVSLAAMIKARCGISSPDQLREASLNALEILRKAVN